MEGYFPTGVQMGFHRRLSRLYNDTKKSSDFVKEAPQNAEDPEVKALHRKLRIQKDRLVSWGLEWSDPSQSAEVLIDTSLSKAGLSEVVGSIMSTIKDILAEAEPLWLSSKRLAGEKDSEKTSPAERKLPTVAWDKGRFEDLVKDLTTSIDTLYDLSRTRSSAATSQAARARLYKSGSSMSTEDLRPFESTRMQTPQQIDPQTLTNLQSMQAEPMSETAPTVRPRDLVFMSKQAYAEMTSSTTRSQYSPLLLEYANFDPIFSTTGIMPSMSRFEKLSSGLQTAPQRSPGAWNGLPQLLGYFEDMENSRLGLVYQFPPSFNPVTFEHLTQNPLNNLCNLSDLLRRPDFEPKLEAKFRLASNLANTVFDMHARGIAHGNLVDSNISFCNATGVEPGISAAEVDVRRPLISSFDLFPDSPSPDSEAGILSPYRHPLDPHITAARGQAPLVANADPRVFDLYSLAMMLLSLGLWTNVNDLVPNSATATIPESVLDQLAIRCGTLYMKAVQACWTAVEKEVSGQITGDTLLSKVQMKASRYLEACCILDGVSNLEERLSDDLGEPRAAPQAVASSSKEGQSSKKAAEAARAMPPVKEPAPIVKPSAPAPPPPKEKSEKTKLRLYPQVSLPPETIEQWHTFLMPQINQALRHFFRQNPESVEISLESIGKSCRETTPTVLIVCTSVKKVRSILTRKLGAVFDEGTGFALKVCRGQVLRSRKEPAAGQSTGNEILAANGAHQDRPQNGASIGAWIGDRHLPPVSFGGLVMVDDKPYGMTVHHMLDDPEVDAEATATEDNVQKIMRSSSAAQEIEQLGQSLADWYAELQAEQSTASSTSDADFACQFSDTETDAYTESDITSTYSDSGDEDDYESREQFGEPGDIPGIEPGCGEGYIVTQPALDDVAEGFFPSEATQDEDHLETFHLGEIHASSGIRRRCDEKGLVHEIDWALFEFSEDRLPDQNVIPYAASGLSRKKSGKSVQGPRISQLPGHPAILHPTTVAAAADLPGMEVQCIARTSGLQTGQILPIITSVKIYGRTTPSHTYQITGSSPLASGLGTRPLPMGIPGDSGAWIVERGQGRLCGHVLAWSQRKKVAYICPMEMLLLDIAETLEAREVGLPGGEPIVKVMDASHRQSMHSISGETGYQETDEGYVDGEEDLGDLVEEEEDAMSPSARLAHREAKIRRAGTGGAALGSPTRCEDLPEDLGKMHIGHDGVQSQG